MSMSVSVLSTALIGLVALPAFATSGFSPADSEVGYTTHVMPTSMTTRKQVTQELAAWTRHPVSSDGWRDVGGDRGWLYVGASASAKLRAEVQRELVDWNRRPVTSDGWKDIGGEAGFVYVGEASGGAPRSIARTR